jgi:hypothetical protein
MNLYQAQLPRLLLFLQLYHKMTKLLMITVTKEQTLVSAIRVCKLPQIDSQKKSKVRQLLTVTDFS